MFQSEPRTRPLVFTKVIFFFESGSVTFTARVVEYSLMSGYCEAAVTSLPRSCGLDTLPGDNPDESIRIASKGIGWPEPAARRAYDLVRPLLSVDGRMDLDAMKVMQDTLLDLGVLKQRLPLDQHYTTEFVPVKI